MTGFYKFFATGFGSGYAPVAPGTAGAIVGCIIYWFGQKLYYSQFYNSIIFNSCFLLLILAFLLIGVKASKHLEKEWGKDPSKIVVDEIVGVWIALLFVPNHWQYLLAGFILFRLFDIWKPLYIRKLEHMKNGWGVMMDDVLAGIYANIVLQFIVYFWKV